MLQYNSRSICPWEREAAIYIAAHLLRQGEGGGAYYVTKKTENNGQLLEHNGSHLSIIGSKIGN